MGCISHRRLTGIGWSEDSGYKGAGGGLGFLGSMKSCVWLHEKLYRVVRKVVGWLYLVVRSCTAAKCSHFFCFHMIFLANFALGNQNVMPVLLVSVGALFFCMCHVVSGDREESLAIFDKADTKISVY